MATPIRAGSSWNPYASYADDEPNTCEPHHNATSIDVAPRISEHHTIEPPVDPHAQSLDPPHPGSGGSPACSVGCGVATSIVCAGVGFGVGLALSPTVVGAAAGAAVGLDCSLLSIVVCEQVCEGGQ
jgi:hypothetical protein